VRDSGPQAPFGKKHRVIILGSALLPVVKDEGNARTENGKEKHAKLEAYIKAGRVPPDGSSPDDLDLYARAAATVGVAENESAEVGIALGLGPDGWVARRYSRDIPSGPGVGTLRGEASDERRQSPVVVADGGADLAGDGGYDPVVGDSPAERASWFVAVADLIQQRASGEYAVFDWKTSSWVQDPKYNWQLLLSGLWLYVAGGRDPAFRCELGAIYIERPVDVGSSDESVLKSFQRTEPYELDAAGAERNLGQLGRLRSRLLTEAPENVELYEGKHCAYCPARHRCPAKIGAFSNLIDELESPGNELTLLKMLMTINYNRPQIDAAAKNILRENGGEMDLGDGRIAVLTKDKRDREKVYTKRAKQTGSNAPEDDKSGEESE
jgi:hypothetical protein